jgi:molecular chaperone GrpE
MSQKEQKAQDNSDTAADPVTPAEENQPQPEAAPDLQQALEAAKAEAAKNHENFLLAVAEAENVRKRAQNEIEAARKFALERFAGELLAVRDSLELASATDLTSDTAIEKMQEGLALTLKQLDTVFEKFSIAVLDPKGEKFDPEKHQAMSMVETRELAPNHVVDVMQKGYMLNSRLLRPAMVIVSKAPAETGPESTEFTPEGRPGA